MPYKYNHWGVSTYIFILIINYFANIPVYFKDKVTISFGYMVYVIS